MLTIQLFMTSCSKVKRRNVLMIAKTDRREKWKKGESKTKYSTVSNLHFMACFQNFYFVLPTWMYGSTAEIYLIQLKFMFTHFALRCLLTGRSYLSEFVYVLAVFVSPHFPILYSGLWQCRSAHHAIPTPPWSTLHLCWGDRWCHLQCWWDQPQGIRRLQAGMFQLTGVCSAWRQWWACSFL